MSSLVFVDVETTGLDETDEMTELSYAVGTGQVQTLYFGVTEVPDFIDKLTSYYARGIHKLPKNPKSDFDLFLERSSGNTMVAANPAFDEGFLKRAGLWNFNHRKLDIESYAFRTFEVDAMPSMAKIHEILTDFGYDLPKPNHTSAGDVIAMRRAYYIMKNDFRCEKRF